MRQLSSTTTPKVARVAEDRQTAIICRIEPYSWQSVVPATIPKIGLSLWLNEDVGRIAEYAKLADRYGFSNVWVRDHYYLRDAFVALALIAAKTERIKVGTSVTSPYLRNPAALASAAASIDEFSKGRMVLGIGSGGYEYPTNLLIDIDKPLAAEREAVEIIRSLWNGDAVSYNGKCFRLKEAKLTYNARSDIPIYLGARGPKTLRLAGEICEGAIIHGVAKKYVAYAVEQVTEGARKAGKDPSRIDIAIQTPLAVGEDRQSIRETLKPVCVIMTGGEYSIKLIDLYGLTVEDVKALRHEVWRSNFQAAVKHVSDKMVDSFCIFGTTDECIQQIEELGRIGISQIIAGSPEKIMASVGKEVKGVKHMMATVKKEIIEYFAERSED